MRSGTAPTSVIILASGAKTTFHQFLRRRSVPLIIPGLKTGFEDSITMMRDVVAMTPTDLDDKVAVRKVIGVLCRNQVYQVDLFVCDIAMEAVKTVNSQEPGRQEEIDSYQRSLKLRNCREAPLEVRVLPQRTVQQGCCHPKMRRGRLRIPNPPLTATH